MNKENRLLEIIDYLEEQKESTYEEEVYDLCERVISDLNGILYNNQ